MPTPLHEFPEQNMEPDEVVEDLECPECDRPMEPQGGGEWKCEWPPCDSNSVDLKDAYTDLHDSVYEIEKKLNRRELFLRGFLKCIKREQIHGSAAFNSMVRDARIMLKLDEKN